MGPNTRVNCVVPGIVPTHFVALYTSNDATVSISFVPNRVFVLPMLCCLKSAGCINLT